MNEHEKELKENLCPSCEHELIEMEDIDSTTYFRCDNCSLVYQKEEICEYERLLKRKIIEKRLLLKQHYSKWGGKDYPTLCHDLHLLEAELKAYQQGQSDERKRVLEIIMNLDKYKIDKYGGVNYKKLDKYIEELKAQIGGEK